MEWVGERRDRPLNYGSLSRLLLGFLLVFWLLFIGVGTVHGAGVPAINAGNAIVFDPDSRQVLFERGSHERIPPASLTKVMTALVAIEEGDLKQVVTIVPADLIGEASMGLHVGDRVTLETLLYGLLLPSGNDAAMAIARGVGARQGDQTGAASVNRFVGWMNELAARISLNDTHYVNPHGLDADQHFSSAADLASLTGFAWENPAFARIFGSITYQGGGFSLKHGNRLVGQYDGVEGGKTGLTDGCGFCLITAARHANHRLVVVVLRDSVSGAFNDTSSLLGWSYEQVAQLPPPAVVPRARTEQPQASAVATVAPRATGKQAAAETVGTLPTLNVQTPSRGAAVGLVAIVVACCLVVLGRRISQRRLELV